MVCGVCIDMSAAYINAIQEHFLHAEIVHDKFHISQHLGYAVDKTRRVEHAMLQKQGDESLTKTKYLCLKGMEHLGDEALSRIKELGRCEFEVSKAWYLKGFSNTSEAAETRCMRNATSSIGRRRWQPRALRKCKKLQECSGSI